jgi:DNA-binding winged helix-turn-helix (wHTH) protein/Tfp pilus assembly protein PilF
MAAMPERLRVGQWHADRGRGIVERGGVVRNLEPKVADLLFLLAARQGELVYREEIFAKLWPDLVVGQDSLSACVTKLRAALGDDARAPCLIETVPKRGYRLIAPVTSAEEQGRSSGRPSWRFNRHVLATAAAGLIAALMVYFASGGSAPADAEAVQLTRRGHDHYFQFRRADNEAAISLYERAIREQSDYGPAYAGMANALVQQVVRWPARPGVPEPRQPSLYEAVASGRTRTPIGQAKLDRALTLATTAVRMAPSVAATHKALGLVHGARGELEASRRSFDRAVEIDPDAWDSLLNLGEMEERLGNPARAITRFEEAYAAMTRVYDSQAVRLRTWYPETGVLIGDRHAAAGRLGEAADWYRKVLDRSPFHEPATLRLVEVLVRLGDRAAAVQLCAELQGRAGSNQPCRERVARLASPP